MKITTIATALAATVATSGAVGIVSGPIATAEDAGTHSLGNQARLVDGDIIQGWTISDLKTSTDVIPHPLTGTLWEATATNEALQGTVTPIVSNLNARARSGHTYRALFQVATAQGVNPATLAQGQKTTGKVYFDVTGDSPESVVYNAGGHDLLIWVQPPPPQAEATWTPAPATRPTRPAPAVRPVPPAPAVRPAAPAPAAIPATPAPAARPATPAPATPPPVGSQGTPLPPGNQGTPPPPGSQGIPLPAGTEGMPAPATLPDTAEGTPPPAGGETTRSPATTPTTSPVAAPPA